MFQLKGTIQQYNSKIKSVSQTPDQQLQSIVKEKEKNNFIMSLKSLQNTLEFERQPQEYLKPPSFHLIDEYSEKFISYPTNDSEVQLIDVKEYFKLEELLQARESAIRLHIQQKNQLRINIENLKEKNQVLAKTHLEMINYFQDKVAALKKENQELRKRQRREDRKEIDLKAYLDAPINLAPVCFNTSEPLQPSQNNINLPIKQYRKVENIHPKIARKNFINTSRKSSSNHQIKFKRSQSLTPFDMIDLKSNKLKVSVLRNSKNKESREVDSKESFRQEIKLIIEKEKNRSLTRVSDYVKLRQVDKDRQIHQNLIKLKTKCQKTMKKDIPEPTKFKQSKKQDKKLVKGQEFGIKKWSSVNL